MQLQHCVNFAPKSEETQKQSPSVAIFLQPNSNVDQKTKIQGLQSSLCDFFPLNRNEDQLGFIVRFLTATFE